ncbi:GNAT family N-acetyltransferase [Cohnella sp. CFH 77786]|uniref:GNAT family N-acetyltransferase n=1 Tax=Cohnella sp. CFH 77786 TaxID=2662265 RepID=UPI001C60A231|nr:GNAT family N-acetyltransferase [Cohnella sp. CFH 77786]MBW5449389.1 GNAT family N-acetyltransferase [Cohnella sp. CFH 77786]
MHIHPLDLTNPDIAEELWALQHAAYRREADLIGVPDLPPLKDTVLTLQHCGETFYGCWTEDGELAGAISIEDEPDGVTVICRMMVQPDYFRKGIGSALVAHVLAEVPGGSEVSVTAETRNEPAVRLYERQGFQPEEIFKPAPGITMVRYVRKA